MLKPIQDIEFLITRVSVVIFMAIEHRFEAEIEGDIVDQEGVSEEGMLWISVM